MNVHSVLIQHLLHVVQVGARIAPRAAGLRFSVESVNAPRPFGFHAAYKWLSSEEMAVLLDGLDGEYARAALCEPWPGTAPARAREAIPLH